ncbi:MAG TPA: Gfo/Idh/MocA family oxidoreductase [Nocardioidaceae bacterium]|nr:Gfo/Idh/MocA family oxidoreductase [Nocardioidaceae bacterium]
MPLPFPPLPPLSVSAGPAVADPLPADRPVRWGILATGKIASGFAQALKLLPDAELAAVAARRLESAERFGLAHGGPDTRAYGSYAELVEDPDVDVVYVATPHALHHQHAMLAFDAGKPVLCEKALTLTAREAEDLVRVSRERGLFFMEAMWMRCNPVIRRVKQLHDRGDLGTIQQVRADLGFRVDAPETDRLLAPELGGGALLDMGVYPLTFAYVFLGDPDKVEAVAELSPSGVDLNIALSLGWESGAVASLSSTMTAWSPRTASIATDRGRIDLGEAFHHPTAATWTENGEAHVIEEDVLGTGLAHEAAEVMRCLRNGEVESPLVPLEESLSIMRLMDRIRLKIGLAYPVDDLS